MVVPSKTGIFLKKFGGRSFSQKFGNSRIFCSTAIPAVISIAFYKLSVLTTKETLHLSLISCRVSK